MNEIILPSGPQHLKASKNKIFEPDLPAADVDLIVNATAIGAGTLVVTVTSSIRGVGPLATLSFSKPGFKTVRIRIDRPTRSLSVSWHTLNGPVVSDGYRSLQAETPLPGMDIPPSVLGPFHVFGVSLRSKKG